MIPIRAGWIVRRSKSGNAAKIVVRCVCYTYANKSEEKEFEVWVPIHAVTITGNHVSGMWESVKIEKETEVASQNKFRAVEII